MVWQQDFSFEAEAWLRHHKNKSPDRGHHHRGDDSGDEENTGSNSSDEDEEGAALSHCVCTLTCGYYSGWIESALGYPVLSSLP